MEHDITLLEGSGYEITLNVLTAASVPATTEEHEVYGALECCGARMSFSVSPTGEPGQWLVTIPPVQISGALALSYQLFVRRCATGHEWLVLSGTVRLRHRYASAGDALATPPLHASATLSADSAALTVTELHGVRGEQGLSTYDIACRQGFVGTEAEWLASLKAEYASEAVDAVAPLAAAAQASAATASTAQAAAQASADDADAAAMTASERMADAETASKTATASAQDAATSARAAANSASDAIEAAASAADSRAAVEVNAQTSTTAANDAVAAHTAAAAAQAAAEKARSAAEQSATEAAERAAQVTNIAEQLEPYTSAEGRNIDIAASGSINTQIGHSYVVTAGTENVSVTDTVQGGAPLVRIPAGKQLGFIAIAENYTLSDTACTVTEVFKGAAFVELSGSGFPDGAYVCFKPDKSELMAFNVDGLTQGDYMFYGINMPSFSSDLSSLKSGSYMFYGTALKSWEEPLPLLQTAYYMYAQTKQLTEWKTDLPAVTAGGGMFKGSGLQVFEAEMPKLKTAGDAFRDCTGLRIFRCNLPALTTGGGMFASCRKLTVFESYLPLLTDGTYTFEHWVSMVELRVDLPKLTNGSYMVQGALVLETYGGNLSSLSTGTSMFTNSGKLAVFESELPSLRTASNMFNESQLNKESALRVLNSIPAYTSGSHPLTIGIHVDNKTDDEVLAAIEGAESKGWMVTVQWNGTASAAAASTYSLRRGNPVYAKLGSPMEDGTPVLDWGHYVTNWEENGYTEFASLEEAKEHFNIKDDE